MYYQNVIYEGGTPHGNIELAQSELFFVLNLISFASNGFYFVVRNYRFSCSQKFQVRQPAIVASVRVSNKTQGPGRDLSVIKLFDLHTIPFLSRVPKCEETFTGFWENLSAKQSSAHLDYFSSPFHVPDRDSDKVVESLRLTPNHGTQQRIQVCGGGAYVYAR